MNRKKLVYYGVLMLSIFILYIIIVITGYLILIAITPRWFLDTYTLRIMVIFIPIYNAVIYAIIGIWKQIFEVLKLKIKARLMLESDMKC